VGIIFKISGIQIGKSKPNTVISPELGNGLTRTSALIRADSSKQPDKAEET